MSFCLSNSGTFTELRTTRFIESTGSPDLIPLAITGYKCQVFLYCFAPVVRIEYDIRTVFTSGSTLWRYLFRVKPPTEFNMTKNCVYSIPCSYCKIYKGETGRPLKGRLEEHRKAMVRGEIEKSGMADHIWKEN